MADFGDELRMLAPWIHEYGVASVFLILVLESFGMPLPGESLLLVASILAGRGEISFFRLLIAAWGGAVVGDNIGYPIGRMLGRGLVLRYGDKIGLTATRLRKAEAVFLRFGPATVGLARFVNVLRQLNGLVAGIMAMDWRRFLLFNALGGALWVLAWSEGGFYLGRHGARIAGLIHRLGFVGQIVALVGVFGAVACIVGYRFFCPLWRDAVRRSNDG